MVEESTSTFTSFLFYSLHHEVIEIQCFNWSILNNQVQDRDLLQLIISCNHLYCHLTISTLIILCISNRRHMTKLLLYLLSELQLSLICHMKPSYEVAGFFLVRHRCIKDTICDLSSWLYSCTHEVIELRHLYLSKFGLVSFIVQKGMPFPLIHIYT